MFEGISGDYAQRSYKSTLIPRDILFRGLGTYLTSFFSNLQSLFISVFFMWDVGTPLLLEFVHYTFLKVVYAMQMHMNFNACYANVGQIIPIQCMVLKFLKLFFFSWVSSPLIPQGSNCTALLRSNQCSS